MRLQFVCLCYQNRTKLKFRFDRGVGPYLVFLRPIPNLTRWGFKCVTSGLGVIGSYTKINFYPSKVYCDKVNFTSVGLYPTRVRLCWPQEYCLVVPLSVCVYRPSCGTVLVSIRRWSVPGWSSTLSPDPVYEGIPEVSLPYRETVSSRFSDYVPWTFTGCCEWKKHLTI